MQIPTELIDKIKTGTITPEETEQLRQLFHSHRGDDNVYWRNNKGYSLYLEDGSTIGLGTTSKYSGEFSAFYLPTLPTDNAGAVSERWGNDDIPFMGEPIQNDGPETARESIGLEAR